LRYHKATKAETKERVGAALDLVQMNSLAKRKPTQLSGGQQHRLCIARTIAVQPDVILMDEPCSALDPISTLKVEETMHELKKEFTIVIVTHNMQQAVRVSDMTAFYNAVAVEGGSGKVGYLVEYDQTANIFNNPQQQATQEYVSGRFG
jgi:phosphate transport system ATP-binding protein